MIRSKKTATYRERAVRAVRISVDLSNPIRRPSHPVLNQVRREGGFIVTSVVKNLHFSFLQASTFQLLEKSTGAQLSSFSPFYFTWLKSQVRSSAALMQDVSLRMP